MQEKFNVVMKEKYKYSILSVCQTLHMLNTGALDGVSSDDEEDLLKWLRNRYETWNKGYETEYDCKVFELIGIVLKEREL